MAAARDFFEISDIFTLENLIECIRKNNRFNVTQAIDKYPKQDSRKLKNATHPDEGPYKGWSLITAAAHSGNPEVVAFLLDFGAKADTKIDKDNDHTPLILAAQRCDNAGAAIVALLLEHGADRNALAEDHNAASQAINTYLGNDPTFTGSLEDLTAILTALRRPQPTASAAASTAAALTLSRYKDHHGNVLTFNILDIAKQARNTAIVGEEAAAFERTKKWRKAKELWTRLGGSMDIEHSVLIDAINEANGHTATEALLLIKAGFNPNETTAGFTPLHFAIREHQIEIIETLLEHGANPQAMTPKGWTQFAFAQDQAIAAMNFADYALKDEKMAAKDAAHRMNLGAKKAWQADLADILEILKEAGIRHTPSNAGSVTSPEALHFQEYTATKGQDTSFTIETLITHLRTGTPFNVEAARNAIISQRLYRELGSTDYDNTDDEMNGWPLILVAVHKRHKEALKLLLDFEVPTQYTAPPKKSSDYMHSWPLISIAAHLGYADIVTLLLHDGRNDPNTPISQENSCTPLMLAAEKGHDEVVDALAQTNALDQSQMTTAIVRLLESAQGLNPSSHIKHGSLLATLQALKRAGANLSAPLPPYLDHQEHNVLSHGLIHGQWSTVFARDAWEHEGGCMALPTITSDDREPTTHLLELASFLESTHQATKGTRKTQMQKQKALSQRLYKMLTEYTPALAMTTGGATALNYLFSCMISAINLRRELLLNMTCTEDWVVNQAAQKINDVWTLKPNFHAILAMGIKFNISNIDRYEFAKTGTYFQNNEYLEPNEYFEKTQNTISWSIILYITFTTMAVLSTLPLLKTNREKSAPCKLKIALISNIIAAIIASRQINPQQLYSFFVRAICGSQTAIEMPKEIDSTATGIATGFALLLALAYKLLVVDAKPTTSETAIKAKLGALGLTALSMILAGIYNRKTIEKDIIDVISISTIALILTAISYLYAYFNPSHNPKVIITPKERALHDLKTLIHGGLGVNDTQAARTALDDIITVTSPEEKTQAFTRLRATFFTEAVATAIIAKAEKLLEELTQKGKITWQDTRHSGVSEYKETEHTKTVLLDKIDSVEQQLQDVIRYFTKHPDREVDVPKFERCRASLAAATAAPTTFAQQHATGTAAETTTDPRI